MKTRFIRISTVLLALALVLVPISLSLATGSGDLLAWIKKTANTSLTKTYGWKVSKWADQTELTLSEGQQFPVNYKVAVVKETVSEWAVSGDIVVFIGPEGPGKIQDVTDVVAPDIAATVKCDGVAPWTIGAWDELICTYEAELPDGAYRINEAKATVELPDGSIVYASGTAPVDFAKATITEVGEPCVDVYDNGVFLGQVCDSAEFKYQKWIGPYDECGEYLVKNVATIKVAGKDIVIDQAEWVITVKVPCDAGCTLTPGYWKTHSVYGPAPYDNTWAQIGEDTPFFLSGQSYYDVLWTSPRGNAYYILAHAYIAAELNVLNGAAIPGDVQAAWDEATVLFQTYTPDEVGKPLKAQFVGLATILDNYNNGIIGPGHCSE